jgi:pilus assembly protein Flp/PilA
MKWKKGYGQVICFMTISLMMQPTPSNSPSKRIFAMLVNYIRTALAVKLNELKVDRRAVTAIEYALIAALIAVVIIGAVTTLGKNVSSTFQSVAAEL